MPEYVLNRTHTLRTDKGHIINFVKGVPVYVPPLIEREAVLIGAERVEGATPSPLSPSVPEQTEEMDGEKLVQMVKTAFDMLLERNDPQDFTGAGVPRVGAVKKIIEADVDSATVNGAWAEYRVEKGM